MAIASKNIIKTLSLVVLLYLPGILFFAMTSPERLPVGLYILPFLYIFVCAYVTARFVLVSLGGNSKYTKLLSITIAALLTLLLLLGSLQQLSSRDVLLLLGIGIIFVWYIRRLSA